MSCSKEELELLEGRNKRRMIVRKEVQQWLPMPKPIDWWSLASAATMNTRIRSIERKIARIEKEKREVVRLQDVV